MLSLADRVEAERARRSLPVFLSFVWPLLEPTPLVPGIAVDLICAALGRVASGQTRRLLINVPPRHLKSLLVSVVFPAWLWASRPQMRFLGCSYGADLAVRDAARMRRLVSCEWYRARYGADWQLRPDQNEKVRFETDQGGARLATSVGGPTTGEGGDLIVIDDPHKTDHAGSAALRQTAIDYYDQTLSTRLNNLRDGAIVVIGQRVHEHDLFGHLLDQGGWDHLCLPAEYDPEHPFLCPDDPRTRPGELLAPARFGPAEIAALKAQLGSYGSAAQLQQLPAPATGGIFARGWWQWYDPAGPLPAFDELLQSWDLAFSGTSQSDYVVGQLWGVSGANMFLLDQQRAQLDFPGTIQAIHDLTARASERFPRRRGHAIYIEEAANGHAVIQTLRDKVGSIIPVHPDGDKIGRAHAISARVEAGNIHLPGFTNAHGTGYDRARTPRWVQDFVEETSTFPNGRHDDQVDAMTQAVLRASSGPRVRTLRPDASLAPLALGWGAR